MTADEKQQKIIFSFTMLLKNKTMETFSSIEKERIYGSLYSWQNRPMETFYPIESV